MKKTYEIAFRYIRWGVAGVLSLIAALPTLTSLSTAI